MALSIPGREDYSGQGIGADPVPDAWIGYDMLTVSDENGKVEHAKPYDETPLPSRGSSRAVIEINAGLSDKLGIQPGDKVCEASVFKCKRP